MRLIVVVIVVTGQMIEKNCHEEQGFKTQKHPHPRTDYVGISVSLMKWLSLSQLSYNTQEQSDILV